MIWGFGATPKRTAVEANTMAYEGVVTGLGLLAKLMYNSKFTGVYDGLWYIYNRI